MARLTRSAEAETQIFGDGAGQWGELIADACDMQSSTLIRLACVGDGKSKAGEQHDPNNQHEKLN